MTKQEKCEVFTRYISQLITYNRPETAAEKRFYSLIQEANRILNAPETPDADQLALFELPAPKPVNTRLQQQLFHLTTN
jgi:agmatine/peptidylarginine deiminase